MFKLLGSNADSRRVLYRFILGFFLANTLLSLLISINYIHVLPHFQLIASSSAAGTFIWGFFIASFIAQIAILYFVCFIFMNMVNAFIPRHRVIFSLSILIGSILVFALIADAITFDLYHLHYAAVGLEIFKVNAFSEVIPVSWYEMFNILGATSVLILIECIIARLVWRHVKNKHVCRLGYGLITIIILCVATSYSLNYVARELPGKYGLNPNNADLMVKATRFIPYYDDVYQFIMPVNNTTRHIETSTGAVDFQSKQINRRLQYPKQVLVCKKSPQPLNIVFIVIDTWRYDAMNSIVTPAIHQFAKKSLQFQNNWSGGNCTKAGLFSLFYGIPENYWDAMLEQKRGPELIHQLIKSNYNMAVFSSAQLNFPAFDQTIFREMKALMIHTPGETAIVRDHAITEEFKKFITTRNTQQPFFSFVFYDAAHSYCDQATPEQHPFNPWQQTCNRFALNAASDSLPYVNRYLNAVHFVDNEIKQVLDTLEQQNLMKNTLVIITADHGEEINDKHSGYWQHASAYTPYQLHTPLLVYWPGVKPKIYTHFTTHYDLAPTLMTQVLNCKNPLADYTIGQSLFNPGHRPVLISSSYADYAIVSNNQVARIYRGGDYEIDDQRGQPVANPSLKISPFQQAYSYLNTYFN